MLKLQAVLVLAALALSACASTEGPGDLESVGTGATQQSAVVQTAPLPAGVTAQPLALPGANATLPPGQTADASQGPNALGDPQVTLQDFSRIDPRQAPGNDPFEGQRAQPLGQSSVADDTLQSAIQAGLQPEPVAPALVPAAPQWPRVSLAPITTAPEPHATQLFDAIDDATFQRGMQLAFFGDESAQYVVRSQVSAIPADQATSLIYVFDVYDARGNLRHRVSGARAIPRSGPDGWALVDHNTMLSVADDVAGRMMAWFRDNPG